jgi:hypothetical protein
MTTLLLALTIALHPIPHHARTPHDIWTLANAVESAATPLVSARLLLAVGFVESTWHPDPRSNRAHWGTWQQNPEVGWMWGDDCWDGDQVICTGIGQGVTAKELTNQRRAAVIAARHLTYMVREYGFRAGVCWYRGASPRSELCASYYGRVCGALPEVCP